MYVVIYSPNNNNEIDYHLTMDDCSFSELEDFIGTLISENPKIDIKHILSVDQEFLLKKRVIPKIFDLKCK